MIEIGFGIVLILAVIGMMNYINTSVGNVQSRRKEISIMESIGMSERQVKKMFIWEGIFYTGRAGGGTRVRMHDRHFGRIKNLSVGDAVIFADMNG